LRSGPGDGRLYEVMRTAMLIVGVQNDFCTGGAREVVGGERVAGPLSCVASAVDHGDGMIVVSREWHSETSHYFRGGGGSLSPYCVAGTRGAGFPPTLTLSPRTRIVYRSTDPEEGDSAFRSTDRTGATLAELLRENGTEELFVGGLPTETTVRATVMEALRRGFRVVVIQDGVAARDPAAGREVLGSLRLAGARVMGSGEAIMSLYSRGDVRL
jgi:nicotinamidase/pyrazinamidase